MAQAQLAAVTERSLLPDGNHRHPRLIEQYGHRVKIATRFSTAEVELTPHRTEHFSANLAAIAAGRGEVLRMHRAHEIGDAVIHVLEKQLDLKEVGALHIVSKR
ncbi:hypothetical protein [Beijerinckia sp. L45]|uniref:hypothetical protein n=1 Tax=Beijerinckia sp. L45 TaxID=1641855 RepID=UPI00131B8FF9|nr:hypothetical protein [Beijerinckia sp. L45]